MVFIFDYSDINIHYVAIFQFTRALNAMTDLVIDRGANRFWKAMIIQRGWDSLLNINDIIMTKLVELIGGDSFFDVRSNHVKDFSSQFASNAHLFHVGWGFDSDISHRSTLVLGYCCF